MGREVTSTRVHSTRNPTTTTNSNNMSYVNSSYQKPPPQTQESKIEAMLDRVLEGQQNQMVDFNGKIDSVYNNLNTKFETLSTHLKKLEIHVVQT